MPKCPFLNFYCGSTHHDFKNILMPSCISELNIKKMKPISSMPVIRDPVKLERGTNPKIFCSSPLQKRYRVDKGSKIYSEKQKQNQSYTVLCSMWEIFDHFACHCYHYIATFSPFGVIVKQFPLFKSFLNYVDGGDLNRDGPV